MRFPRGEKLLVALGIAAGAAGCAGEEAGAKDVKYAESDSANAKIYNGEEDVVQEEDVLVVPKDEPDVEQDVTSKDVSPDIIKEKSLLKEEKKVELREIREEKNENYLLKEIEELSAGKSLPGFDMEAEIKRVIPKVVKEYSDKMFGDSTVHYIKKHFKDLLKDKEYRKKVRENVMRYCEQYQVPLSVAYGILGAEEGGTHRVMSDKGAYGIFQVKQDAADHLRDMKFNDEDWKGVDINNLEDNIRAGIAYARYLYERYGQWGLALSAYNGGPGKIEKSIAHRFNKYNYDRYSIEKRKNKLAKPPQRITKEMIKKYPGGWPAFLRDNGINVISACSKKGLGTCKHPWGAYPINAMSYHETVKKILEADTDEIEIVLITDQFK